MQQTKATGLSLAAPPPAADQRKRPASTDADRVRIEVLSPPPSRNERRQNTDERDLLPS